MYDALLIQLEKSRVPITASPYTFDFGPKELVNMVGIPQNEGVLVLRKMMENKKIQMLKDKEKDKIHSMDVSDISKQTEYYRKMQKIEKARREGTLSR
jgi:phosphoenolpyruvate synthase/pyruvate phosphate dikinase